MMSVDPTYSFLRTHRDRLVLGAFLAISALGLAGLARTTDWADIRARLALLTLTEIAALLALSLVNYGLRGARWHLFARSLGAGTGLATNLLQYIGGFAMSVTPGKIGELVRVRWLSRASGLPLERAAPAALADRALDLAALAVLLAGCLAFSTAIRGGFLVAALALAAAFVATHPTLLARLTGIGHLLAGRRLPRLFARLRRAALSLDRVARGGVLVPALILGLIGWAAEGYAFHLLLGWFGADLSYPRALAIFIFASLAGGLTGAPGGIGGAEAAMVALLSLEGIGLDTSVPATVIIRFTTLWFAVLLGAAAFPLAERLSQKDLTLKERE